MARVPILLAAAGLIVLGLFPAGCRRRVSVTTNPGVPPTSADTAHVVAFRDTVVAAEERSNARSFNLRNAGQRDSLRALLRKEHALWRAKRPRDYRFLLRVSCFCPAQLGWVSMEIRDGQPPRAWDRTGKVVPISDWNTFSVDGLFDHLESSVDRYGGVQIAFDPRWHFPAYVSTVVLPGPDRWATYEARGFIAVAPVR